MLRNTKEYYYKSNINTNQKKNIYNLFKKKFNDCFKLLTHNNQKAYKTDEY